MAGTSFDKFFCIEVFAGSGRLTACLRQVGLVDSFGVDNKVPQGLKSPLIQLDLLNPIDVSHLETLLNHPSVVYVHFAPPCGTASRARLIQTNHLRQSMPPVARTAAFPDGLPSLSGTLADRVSAANKLYEITCSLVRLCYQQGIMFSIENPGRSFMWDTQHFRALLQDIPTFSTFFHHCEFGSDRRKFTRLVHVVPQFLALQKSCQGNHSHEPWGYAGDHWATSEETAYPWKLCREITFAMLIALQNFGATVPRNSFVDPLPTLQNVRGSTGFQSKRGLPPMVPEFKQILLHDAFAPLPPLCRPLSTARLGTLGVYFASEGAKAQVPTSEQVLVGLHFSPDEFMQRALESRHPTFLDNLLPEELTQAVEYCANNSDVFVALGRTEEIKRWIQLAVNLKDQEFEAKKEMSSRRFEILKTKRLCLLQRLLNEISHPDENLVADIARGFDLVGELPKGKVFEQKVRPASLAPEALRSGADNARRFILDKVKSSGDETLDWGLLRATELELEKGFLKGPVPLDSLPRGATLTQRFAVQQGEKLRPIDNYKTSLVNSAVSQNEKVSVHTIDFVAALLGRWQRSHLESGKSPRLNAKAWDLASAYKQIPLSDHAFDLDSYIVLFSPKTKGPLIYQQTVLPFGAVASVTAFIRCSVALWSLLTRKLRCPMTAYFDDFLSLTSPNLSRHTDLVLSTAFQLLGWRVAEDKLLPFSYTCKILGVQLDLSRIEEGLALVANTESRKAEITRSIETILQKGKCDVKEAERLRGRLQFSSGQIFGRRLRHAIHLLAGHERQRKTELSHATREALQLILHVLQTVPPREVRSTCLEFCHIYVDACFSKTDRCGIGGMILNHEGSILGHFAEEIPEALVKELLGVEKETAIFELESFAAVLAINLWKDVLRGRSIVIFSDNEAFRSAVVRCHSSNARGDRLVQELCRLEEDLHTSVWLERVASQSNPADPLSRGVECSYTRSERRTFDVIAMWRFCLGESVSHVADAS